MVYLTNNNKSFPVRFHENCPYTSDQRPEFTSQKTKENCPYPAKSLLFCQMYLRNIPFYIVAEETKVFWTCFLLCIGSNLVNHEKSCSFCNNSCCQSQTEDDYYGQNLKLVILIFSRKEKTKTNLPLRICISSKELYHIFFLKLTCHYHQFLQRHSIAC